MATNWTNEQSRAIETADSNILVAAAAGSGKTAVLVERIIRKITDAEKPVDIDKIIVVTFTNAAAAEMRYRIRNAIDAKLEQNPADDNLLRQISLINNARICTIDSFCLNLIHNYFSDVDIDPGFRTADKAEINLIENDVLETMLEECYEQADEEFMDFVEKYGTGRDDSKVVELILQVYRFARSHPWEDEWYDECEAMYDTTKDSLDDKEIIRYMMDSTRMQLKDYIDICAEAVGICEMDAGLQKYLPVYQSEKMYMEKLYEAEKIKDFIQILQNISFERLPAAKGCEPENKALVTAWRDKYKKHIKELQKNVFAGGVDKISENIVSNGRSVRTLVKLAREYSCRMREEKRARNVIDFNDMEHLALSILVKKKDGRAEYTEVADTLAHAYEEVMIDEYQDSNMLQEVILNAVSKNRFESEPDNMYMVGDVKQSIYRFRMACPDLFIEKYDSYRRENSDTAAFDKAGMRIELQNNFRSRENVLECCNDIFFKLMNPDFCQIEYDDSAKLNPGAKYQDAPAEYKVDGVLRKSSGFGQNCETVVEVISGENENSEKTETEAAHIADIIEELVNPSDGSVKLVACNVAAGGYRPVEYRDIVILTRAGKGWAETIVNMLLSRDIPAYSEASSGYFNLREIQMVMNYLAIVDNPLQDVAFTGAVLSYFGGFDTIELSLIRGNEKKKNLYTQFVEHKDSDKKVNAFIETLERYRQLSELLSVYELLWKIIYDTGYYDFVGTMPAGKRRQANLDILLQRAQIFENTSYRGLFNFLRYIERLKAFDDSVEEASFLSENDNLVRVMTIHKSKGLEFPIVILAGMGKQLNFSDTRKKALADQKLGIGLDNINLEKRTRSSTIFKDAIIRKNKIDTISEEMRVLYVALTRAKEKLYITGSDKSYDKKKISWQITAEQIEKRGGYSYAECLDIKTYFDMFMPVVLGNSEKYKGRFVLNEYEADSIVVEDGAVNEEVTEEMHQGQESFILPEYKYEAASLRKAKVTVTQLKKLQADADISEKDMTADDVIVDESSDKEISEEINIPVPSFMSDEEEELVGNERGTAYHRVMECLDYSAFEGCSDTDRIQIIRKQLEKLVETKKMDEIQVKCIRPKDISAFIGSSTGIRAASASARGELMREQPFVFIDDEADDEQTKDLLVQGVIDMYFIEEYNGERCINIVDYKTDRFSSGGKLEETLVKRYKIQLEYYAKALEQLTGLRVKDKIIYSFTLNKEIIL